jgi:hypothetical protein
LLAWQGISVRLPWGEGLRDRCICFFINYAPQFQQ